MSLDNGRKDLITPEDLGLHEAPSGADRRAFLMRSAAIAARCRHDGLHGGGEESGCGPRDCSGARGKSVR